MTDNATRTPQNGQEAQCFQELRQMSANPERIIFVVDLCQEMLSEFSENLCRVNAVKKLLQTMIWRKSASPFRHEYALVIFYSDRHTSHIRVACPVTKNFEEVKNAIDALTVAQLDPSSSYADEFNSYYDLDSLFKMQEVVELTNKDNTAFDVDCNRINRFIIIYGSSFTVSFYSSSL